ncbi:MAG TPA: RIP metalloprotease RseP [Gammaproteobacteria bacterium]
MSQFFISLLAFVVALGVLVTVHEFGHFWVARKLGVKVLRFSVGFGKPILRYCRKNDPTEYVISALPLGGYVKMLDEREGEVKPEERRLAFNNQSVWTRIAIVSAGPLFNILLAIVVYTAVFCIGITGIKPVVGGVTENSFAGQAGFQAGDEIVTVDSREVRTWQEVRLAVLETVMDEEDIFVGVVTPDSESRTRVIQLNGKKILKDQGDIIEMLGFRLWEPKVEPVISEVIAGGAADKAGLLAGDKILGTAGEKFESWREWALYVRQRPEQPIDLQVLRDGETLTLTVIPESKPSEEGTIGIVGAAVNVQGDLYRDHRVMVRYNPVVALGKGLQKTGDMTLLTFRMIGELITGSASVRNVSGPITIAEYAGKTVSIGLSYFLDLLAIISVSLAVLNILPIPLLDGGHLLYFLVEIVKGSPLSERAQLVGQNIGIIILGCLMTLAFYNDIARLLG